MTFVLLQLILSCSEPRGYLGQLGLERSSVSKTEQGKSLALDFKLLGIYPQGWPEFDLNSEEVIRLVKRSLFKHDPRLLHVKPSFWEALRLQAAAMSTNGDLKYVLNHGGNHPFFDFPTEPRFQLIQTIVELREIKSRLNVGPSRASLIQGFYVLRNYNSERSLVDVYRVALALVREGKNVVDIHRVFKGNHGRTIFEADLLIREPSGAYSIVEVKPSFHLDDRRFFDQLNNLKRQQRKSKVPGFLFDQVYLVATHILPEGTQRKIENRYAFQVREIPIYYEER